MTRYTIIFVSHIAMAMLLCFPGCGADSLDRQAVSGTVNLAGQPLDQGMINFIPQEKATVGGGAVVANGAYAIASDKGLPPGKYLVRIFSTKHNPNKPAGSLLPGGERIAPEYNIKSKLMVEVISGGDNQFDFDLKGT